MGMSLQLFDHKPKYQTNFDHIPVLNEKSPEVVELSNTCWGISVWNKLLNKISEMHTGHICHIELHYNIGFHFHSDLVYKTPTSLW